MGSPRESRVFPFSTQKPRFCAPPALPLPPCPVALSRSYLDMSKVIIFSYLFWFVLTIIFITGTTRISIFCMGYLVACFYFLLFGGDLLLKPIKSILRYWDWLIAYNVFVITMKNILSVSASRHTQVGVRVRVGHHSVVIRSLSHGSQEPQTRRCRFRIKGALLLCFANSAQSFLLISMVSRSHVKVCSKAHFCHSNVSCPRWRDPGAPMGEGRLPVPRQSPPPCGCACGGSWEQYGLNL